MIIVMKIFRLAALIILAMGMQYPSYSQTTDVSPELTKLISIFSDNIPNGFGNDQDHFYLVEFGKDSTLVSRPRLGFDVLLIRYIETKHHPFTYKSFRIINNHKVYFYGKKNSFFSFNALNRVKLPEKSAEPLGIIDPSDYEWRICLFKDGSINEYLTERNIIHTGRDSVIDDIVPILKQPDPLVVEKWLSNYIFGSSTDVFLDYQAEPSPNEYLALEALKYCSKDIIPILIEEIADTTMVCPADFRDPLNSTLEKANKFFNNRSGIRYAHMLEFYLNLPLSKEVEATIERLDSIYPDYDKYKWRYYKVYNAGMIFRTEKNKSPIYQTLSAQDMKNVYIQYLNWWNANKNRSLDEIRAKYKKTSGILRYPYKWF